MTDQPGHDPAARGSAGWRAPGAFPDVDYGHLNGWDRDFEAFSDFDLPTFVGPTTFSNLPWVTEPGRDQPARRRRGDHRGALRRRRQPPARRPLRPARHPRGELLERVDQLAPARSRGAVRRPHRGRRRRREHHPGLDRARPRVHLPQGPRGGGDRRDPDRPGRRPLDHLAVGHRDRRGPPAGQHRDRPLRRPRRHGARGLGCPRRARDADAAADRERRGQGQELRPGGPARLLAAGGRLRVDEGPGDALAPHARDRGARRRGGDRRRDRRGARRAGRRLPLHRHRRHRPRHGARDRDSGARRHADPRGPAGDPPDRRRPSTWPGWTSWRSRRRTTMPRSRRRRPIAAPSRRSPRSRSRRWRAARCDSGARPKGAVGTGRAGGRTIRP